MTSRLDTSTSEPDPDWDFTTAISDHTARLIDEWFPCSEIDAAVRTPAGSGRSEKALFTWFASRPIAQARAAVLCSLLPDNPENRADIKTSILSGSKPALKRLQTRIAEQYGKKRPVVLDMFSGRGIIPLEAARAGASAVGTDLSPVATLAGRLLADYPLRDWSTEPPLPFAPASQLGEEDIQAPFSPGTNRRTRKGLNEDAQPTLDGLANEPRLLTDVRTVLAEVGQRVADEVAHLYACNRSLGSRLPWAYLWAVTMPCDGCGRRFPLVGGTRLRFPNLRRDDPGQSFYIATHGDAWRAVIHDGSPKGKSA